MGRIILPGDEEFDLTKNKQAQDEDGREPQAVRRQSGLIVPTSVDSNDTDELTATRRQELFQEKFGIEVPLEFFYYEKQVTIRDKVAKNEKVIEKLVNAEPMALTVLSEISKKAKVRLTSLVENHNQFTEHVKNDEIAAQHKQITDTFSESAAKYYQELSTSVSAALWKSILAKERISRPKINPKKLGIREQSGENVIVLIYPKRTKKNKKKKKKR